MKHSKKKILLLMSITTVTSLIGVVYLNAKFDSFASLNRTSAVLSYNATIRASDLANKYVVSSGGARLDFETSGVSAANGDISISKNGFIRFTVQITGTTSLSINVPNFSDSDKLMVSSGYKYNDYGAACYLTKANNSMDTYYRTYFQFSSDSNTLSVNSITINYSCSAHYEFTPIMNSVTENVNYGTPEDVYHYSGLTYEDDIEPNLNEVTIEEERFDLDLSQETTPEPSYSIHPVVKFYDKGGCLIKQAQGFWLCHVNPIIRFFIAKDKFEAFTFELNDDPVQDPTYFDLNVETSPLYNGVLSGFNWEEYTKEDGVLRKPLTKSMDLYPEVIVNINPGAYSEDLPSDIKFTPDPDSVNYGFPTIPDPSVISPYEFAYWRNGEEIYHPEEASDFHDYDLYAEFKSEFDLRLKFQNRGFNNAYYEVGVPNGETYTLPADGENGYKYIDQSTIGMHMGEWFVINEGTGKYEVKPAGYLVYPQGHREEAVFYEAGKDVFTNDGKGTSSNPAVYIAEPYIKYVPEEMFDYLAYQELPFFIKNGTQAFVTKHYEHMYYDGVNDLRTYFKKITLPDSLYNVGYLAMNYGTNGIIDCDLEDRYDRHSEVGIGITDSKELEVVVGNSEFTWLHGGDSGRGYSFKNNTALKRLEYFPALTTISKYTFWGCTSLEPLQNWKDMGPIDTIKEHAFDGCYVNPIIDESGNISRRTFELPSTLVVLGDYAFAKSVYTDFYLDKTSLNKNWITLDAFAYSEDNSHSAEFAKVLEKYNAGTADIAAVKAVANHVIFNGTKAEFEALVGTYNETDVLLTKEYYVTFED